MLIFPYPYGIQKDTLSMERGTPPSYKKALHLYRQPAGPPMAALNQITQPKTLKTCAYESIYNAILSGELKGGTLYSEPELALRLGISRTPIREALLQLSSKGFIQFVPRRGFLLSEISPQRLSEMCSYRTLLELGVIRLVAPQITPAQVEEARKIVLEMETNIDDCVNSVRLDRAFHFYLVELTGNEFIIQAMHDIRNLIDWAAVRLLASKERREVSIQEHSDLLLNLQRNDIADSVASMERHMATSRQLALASFLSGRDSRDEPSPDTNR